MILLGNLLLGISRVLDVVINIVIWLMIIRAVLSWVNPDPNNPIVQFLYSSTDPLLQRVRRYVKPVGMFDISVIVVILVLYFLETFLVGSIAQYGARFVQSALTTP